MRGLPTVFGLVAQLAFAGCSASDVCDPDSGVASTPDPALSALTIGQTTAAGQFEPLASRAERELVMGEQGVAMFHHIGLQAAHVMPVELGRTSDGWSLSAETPDGDPLGTVWSPHIVQAIPPAGFEVTEIRLVPTPPPLQIWDTDVVLKASVDGLCGGSAQAQVTVQAVRVR